MLIRRVFLTGVKPPFQKKNVSVSKMKTMKNDFRFWFFILGANNLIELKNFEGFESGMINTVIACSCFWKSLRRPSLRGMPDTSER